MPEHIQPDLYVAVVIQGGFPILCHHAGDAALGGKEYIAEVVKDLQDWFPGRNYSIYKLVKES